MQGRSTIWFPIALLALLAGLTLWVDRVVQPPQPKIDGSSRHDPDYILSNFNTIKTDQNGNPRHRLAATEMRHFPDDDTTQLTRPRFTQYTAYKPFTQIEGQRGLVTSDGENVYFMDNVKIVRGATPQKGELTVQTDYMHIIPDKELAMTDRPVLIKQAPDTVIRATGMEYDKKLGILKLFKRVSVHYVKPKAKTDGSAKPPKKPAPSSSSSSKKNSKPSAQAKQAGKAKTGNTSTRTRR
jgi:lipopolysaccharide export system protein LptC